MSFFKSGFTAFEEVEKVIDAKQAERAASGGNIYRFWMKENEDKNVIFLTGADAECNDVPVIEEHSLQAGPKQRVQYTCLKVIGEACPLCEAGDRPYVVGFFLVIDRSKFTSTRTKKDYVDTLKVYAVKFGALKILKKLAAHDGGLKGVEYILSRTGPKTANTGDSFIKETKHTGAVIKGLLQGKGLLETLDPTKKITTVKDFWEQYLAPKSRADLVVLVSNKQTGTGPAAVAGALPDGSDVDFDN